MLFEVSKETRKWSLISRGGLVLYGFALILLKASFWFAIPLGLWYFVHLALFLKVDATRDPDDIL